MAETVTMPKLGFDMAEGTLVRWVISEGDEVTKGAVLAEIETDKATVEVESTVSGVMRRQLVPEGEVVPVGAPIAIVGGADEEIDESGQPAGGPSTEQVIDATEDVPPGGFTPQEVAAESGGGAAGSMATTGDVKMKDGAGAEQEPAETEAGGEPEGDGRFPDGLRASPLARRIAAENQVELRQIKGSGPQGRVIKKDVESFLERQAAAPAPAAAPAAAPAPAGAPAPEKKAAPQPVFSPLGPPPEDERIKINRLRSAIGRRMTEAKQQVPHFYVTHEYKMRPLLDLRKQVNAMLPEEEKVSVNDFIVKAVALALRQFPNLNASLDGAEVVRHGQVNVGVAVAVEGGLLTVVCRDADRKPLRQIAVEVRNMVGRAREGRVRPDDIEGSTFSVSNLGMFDVEHFIAIINPPEAAILAVGSAMEVPVVENGEIKPGLRMKATISVDHRVSDGAEAAQFLQALALYIEEPLRLLV